MSWLTQCEQAASSGSPYNQSMNLTSERSPYGPDSEHSWILDLGEWVDPGRGSCTVQATLRTRRATFGAISA